MTPRENLKSLLRRTGYESAPPFFFLCPYLETVYRQQTGSDQPVEEHFGFVTPLIPDFIEAGVDVLNPVQPECGMDFAAIHAEFGDRLSFWGAIGTQSTMPFGAPEEIKREVWKNLDIAGEKGGLWCTPTHILEPEVPWHNILAYVQACREVEKGTQGAGHERL